MYQTRRGRSSTLVAAILVPSGDHQWPRTGRIELSYLPAVELSQEQSPGECEDGPSDGSVARVGHHAAGLLAHAFPPGPFGVRERCLVLVVGKRSWIGDQSLPPGPNVEH